MSAGAKRVTVTTHRRPDEIRTALAALREAALAAGATLRFDAEETAKLGLEPAEGLKLNAPLDPNADLCIVLGGDGTILRALGEHVDTEVPIFAVNYGEVGFLATIDPEPERLRADFERALAGEFEVMRMPGLEISGAGITVIALNDASMARKPGLRVADIAYASGDDEIGNVRCDGIVVATPAGSTGYNLANGGPVMAWGVEGMVVSFVAPHSLTARTLVVAPGDVLTVSNRSPEEHVDLFVDGRPVAEAGPGKSIDIQFTDDRARLAQLPGATFYHRLREKFGRMAS
jgi:NAD+ kinase